MTNKVTRTFASGMHPKFTQFIDSEFQISEIDGNVNVVEVEGYGAIYDNWFVVSQSPSITVKRRNNQGMFARALAQNPDVVLRLDHEQALARTKAKTLTLEEDMRGLKFRGQIDTAMTSGNDVVQGMKNGLYTQGSVQYWPARFDEWKEREPGGGIVMYQDVHEGILNRGDVTITTFGANPLAETSLSQMIATVEGRDSIRQMLDKYSDDSAEVAAEVETEEPVEQAAPTVDYAAVREVARIRNRFQRGIKSLRRRRRLRKPQGDEHKRVR